MPPRPAGIQLGLFDNPVRVYGMEELAETVRKLDSTQPGRTVEEITAAVFAELAMQPTRRARDLVTAAIRIARQNKPRVGITGTPWQASTTEVRDWQPLTASRSASTAPSPHRPSAPTTRHTQTGHTDHNPPHSNTSTQ